MTEEIECFRKAAARFCDLIEAAPEHESSSWLISLLAACSDLYSSALRLPPIDRIEPGDTMPKQFGLPKQEMSALRHALDNSFGDLRFYKQPNMHEESDQSDAVEEREDLVSDVLLIYEETKPGLAALAQTGTQHLQDIVWDWRQLEFPHWGSHVVDVIWILHKRVIDEDAAEDPSKQ